MHDATLLVEISYPLSNLKDDMSCQVFTKVSEFDAVEEKETVSRCVTERCPPGIHAFDGTIRRLPSLEEMMSHKTCLRSI